MTGSLSIRGAVLPVGGVTAKIEAAAKAGLKKILVPQANLQDVLIEEQYQDKITIVPVTTLKDVLENALVGTGKQKLLNRLASLQSVVIDKVELESERMQRRVQRRVSALQRQGKRA